MGYDKELIMEVYKKLEKICDKIYSDEPIIIPASQMKNYTPPEITKMRMFAKRNFGRMSQNEVFYRQAKLLENYSDEFEQGGDFNCYYPTYQSMNDRQLRSYFSWRTKVRNGQIFQTSLSFVYVYIYELLNMIGCDSPNDAYLKLKAFTDVYSGIDNRIIAYTRLWKRDFVVYNNLDPSYIESSEDLEFEQNVHVLMNYENYTPEKLFAVINRISPYNLGASKFGKAYPVDSAEIFYRIFAKLSEYYAKKRTHSLCESLFGMVYSSGYNMFKSAVFYCEKQHEDCVYKVNDLDSFICKDGIWTCNKLLKYSGKNKRLANMMKGIDFVLREKYAMRSQLKCEPVSAFMRNIIEASVAEYSEQKRKSSLPKIDIDISALQSIRDNSEIIRDKLITEDEKEDIEVLAAEVNEKTTLLNENENEFIKKLLENQPYFDIVRKSGKMLSLLCEEINEKLFEEIGDTVIAFDGDTPYIIEDYLSDLEGMVQ